MSTHPVVGAMPPPVFLSTLMDVDLPSEAPEPSFSSIPLSGHTRDMCEPFVRAVDKAKVFPGMRLFVTRTKKRKLETSDMAGPSRLDLHPPLAARKAPKHRRGTRSRKPVQEYYDFATASLIVEVYGSSEADPFDDPPRESSMGTRTPTPPPKLKSPDRAAGSSPLRKIRKSPHLDKRTPTPEHCHQAGTHDTATPHPRPLQRPTPQGNRPTNIPAPHTPPQRRLSDAYGSYESFDHLTPQGTAARKSLMRHAEAQFARQHRLFLFQVVIVNRWARFIRWDRSGAVVSERFDYVEFPKGLGEFFWRYAHMTDEQRGWDPTVRIATRKEAALFRDAMQGFLRQMESRSSDVRRLPDAELTLDDTKTYPTWKIRVDNPASGDHTDLIVNRPFSGHHSLEGRATRAYIAYDLRNHRLVFFKDSWRRADTILRPEFHTYQELLAHHVPHLPSVLYGGDVSGSDALIQETSNHDWAEDEDDWRVTETDLKRYIHHRIVQDILYPLESVRGPKELVQVIHDTLCAIDRAFSAVGLLHRDVSLRNIMLTAEGRGVLNDWDYAGGDCERSPGIGTWAFMSAELLKYPEKDHVLVDDIESAFWVLVYVALKLFAQPEQEFPGDVFSFELEDNKGRIIGGGAKKGFISSGDYTNVKISSDVLRELICKCGDIWQIYYLRFLSEPPNSDDLRREIQDTSERACRPSFWIEMFAESLQSFPAESSETAAAQPSQYQAMTSKRKSDDMFPENRSLEYSPSHPRRSKRLKALAAPQ